MRATQTYIVDLRKLERQAEATLVIRLMRAADDIALANWGLGEFTKDQPRLKRHVQEGARRYFVRLQCGHAAEAIKLIDEVKKSQRLASLLPKCADFAQDAFGRLVQYVPRGSRRRNFEQWVKSIRDKAAFHYDPRLVAAALSDRARHSSTSRCTITRGTAIDLWRSGLADDIEDSIVCRQVWQIPPSADVRAEANKILEFASALCRDYLDFSGELTFLFLRETATV